MVSTLLEWKSLVRLNSGRWGKQQWTFINDIEHNVMLTWLIREMPRPLEDAMGFTIQVPRCFLKVATEKGQPLLLTKYC